MTSPNSNEDASSSKYHIQIGEDQGIVIGEHAQVVQQFYGLHTEHQVDLAAAEATYRQKVVDAYKWLDFGGFARSDLSLANVPLEKVFVRLSLTVEKVIRELVPPENPGHTGQRKSRQRERVIKVQEPIELGQALSNHLLIVGEPGAGKSTLLRWLAVTFAEARQREPNRLGPAADADRLPVLVELGDLHDRYLKPEGGETPTWHQYLPEYLTVQDAFTNTPPQLLTQALDEGRCLLLFDGLDEIVDRQVRARIAHSLAELTSHFPGNRVIIGSRSAGVSETEGVLHPLLFHRCQIERFTSENVQRFFHFWYALDHGLTPEQQREAADALYARVQATPATLQLATTPLLSTILVLIWRNEGDLPERRGELYEHCCRVMIEHWEASHDVAYQSKLAGLDWEDHLQLLSSLAYAIHNQEQRTSATREELVHLLAHTLQAMGYSNDQAAAIREAKNFLEILSLRSGLLQYMGSDRYGFPHLTFQEYLAARYIAAQPDTKYIDLVMEHLHEAWWQEVHLLTIAHLGSDNKGVKKASALILTILRLYTPPSWILRPSRHWWLRLLGPGKLLYQMHLEQRIAWVLAREFELAIRGYAECVPDSTTAKVGAVLSAQAASLVRHIVYDNGRREAQKALLIVACKLSQRQNNQAAVRVLLEALRDANEQVRMQVAESLGQLGVGNEAVVNALLEALHDAGWQVREQAAESLGQMGVGNEAVVNGLLEALRDAQVRKQAAESLGQVGVGNEAVVNGLLKALHDTDEQVRKQAAASLGQVVKSLNRVGVGNEVAVNALLKALQKTDGYVKSKAAESLGQMEIKDPIQLRQVLIALNHCLHNFRNHVRLAALLSLRQLLDGRPIPGYRWISLQKRKARLRSLKRIAILAGVVAILLSVALTVTLLDPTSLIVRWVTSLSILASIVSIIGVTLRDLLERKKSNQVPVSNRD